MYAYDVYADARQTLPRVREPLQAMDGEYYLVKTDILARTMSFSSSKETMSNVVTIPTSRVREIIAMNRAGKRVESLLDKDSLNEIEEPTYRTEEDSITRFDKSKKRKKKRSGNKQHQPKAEEGQQPTTDVATEPKAEAENPEQGRGGDRRFPNRGRQHRHHNRRPNGGKGEGKSEPKVE